MSEWVIRKIGGRSRKVSRFIRKVFVHSRKIKGLIKDSFGLLAKSRLGFARSGAICARSVALFARSPRLRKIKGLIGYFSGYSQGRGWVSQDRSLYSQGLSRFTQDQGLDWMLFGLLARSRLGFASPVAQDQGLEFGLFGLLSLGFKIWVRSARSVALFARSSLGSRKIHDLLGQKTSRPGARGFMYSY